MYMTVEKNVKKVQRTEVSFSILKEFWKKRENYRGAKMMALNHFEKAMGLDLPSQ